MWDKGYKGGTWPPCPDHLEGEDGAFAISARGGGHPWDRDKCGTNAGHVLQGQGDKRDTPLKGCPVVPPPALVCKEIEETPPSAVRVAAASRNRGGAPVRFDPTTLWPIILHDIANGAALSSALRRLEPSPSYWWAQEWLRRDPDLKRRYQTAVEDRADFLAEELIELADQPIPPGLDGPSASAWVQRLRIQVDVRKWAACKLKPRSYGDRLDVNMTEKRLSITSALANADLRLKDSLQHLEAAPIDSGPDTTEYDCKPHEPPTRA